jgi:hypothetical protein
LSGLEQALEESVGVKDRHLRRKGIGTKRKNIIATKAIRTLPPVVQCSVAPAAIKSAKPAASTQLVEFFVEPGQAASNLVALVEGHTVDVSEISEHVASCTMQSERMQAARACGIQDSLLRLNAHRIELINVSIFLDAACCLRVAHD